MKLWQYWLLLAVIILSQGLDARSRVWMGGAYVAHAIVVMVYELFFKKGVDD